MEAKTVTLKQVGWRCKGFVLMNCWDGTQGNYRMDSWDIPIEDCENEEQKEALIISGINDGRFGCESIEEARVHIYEIYEGNTDDLVEVFVSEELYEKEEVANAKLGI